MMANFKIPSIKFLHEGRVCLMILRSIDVIVYLLTICSLPCLFFLDNSAQFVTVYSFSLL